MVLLNNGQFLNELGKLFERSKEKHTVLITMKRTNLKHRKARKPNPDLPYVCLVRATVHKKKISTVVTQKEQARFQESFNTICKAHMDSLKKRERKKEKAKGT